MNTLVSDTCGICGSEISPEDNFCRTCGKELYQEAEPTREKPAPERHISIGIFLLVFGGITATASLLIGVSSTLALGVSAILLGIMTLYLPESNQRLAEQLASDSSIPALLNIENLLEDLALAERGIYIPANGLGVCPKVFLPLTRNLRNKKPPRELNDSRRVFITLDEKTREGGLLLEAPGRNLMSRMERALRLDLSKVEVGNLNEKLESGLKLLDVSNAITFRSPDSETFTFQLELGTLGDLEIRLSTLVPSVAHQIGTPIASAIAAAVSKSTGKYVAFRDISFNSTGKEITATLELGQ